MQKDVSKIQLENREKIQQFAEWAEKIDTADYDIIEIFTDGTVYGRHNHSTNSDFLGYAFYDKEIYYQLLETFIPDWKLEEYNGWDNYYSWCINLWITNSESTYNHFKNIDNIKEFTEEIENYIPSIPDFNHIDTQFILHNLHLVDIESIYQSL